LQRRIRKTLRIGLLGAINGVRIRPWFSSEPAALLGIESLEDVAARHQVPFFVTPATNSLRTVELMTEAAADLGISLGNSYIARRVFDIPSFGMINTHHEALPEYRGAQSVLWQLYDGSRTTGFTVHQIDSAIDGGAILHRETVPIEFCATLHETVVATCASLYVRSLHGLTHVVDHFGELSRNATPQGGGASFTTPTLWQFFRMVRNHRRLRARAV
jgi:methionyl-tRNA formyltransferase